MSLGGWQLKQTVGDKEITYKFNRNAQLKPEQTITVSLSCGFISLDCLVSRQLLPFCGQDRLIVDFSNPKIKLILQDNKCL